ncbi:MAG TPA: hypothetical protein VLN48_09200 [Bryobacteraceae bacterium]|nr:hypothetical protein [Bryobacteraceae bacterium]
MKHLCAILILLSVRVWAQDSAAEPAQSIRLSGTLGSAEFLLLKLPAVIPSSLDFGQIAREKLPVFSLEGISWTVNRFAVQGMTATDPYQPGRPVALPDPHGVSQVRLGASAPTLFYDFREPAQAWHGSGSAFFTGGSLFSNNLPASDARGPHRGREYRRPVFGLSAPHVPRSRSGCPHRHLR